MLRLIKRAKLLSLAFAFLSLDALSQTLTYSKETFTFFQPSLGAHCTAYRARNLPRPLYLEQAKHDRRVVYIY